MCACVRVLGQKVALSDFFCYGFFFSLCKETRRLEGFTVSEHLSFHFLSFKTWGPGLGVGIVYVRMKPHEESLGLGDAAVYRMLALYL